MREEEIAWHLGPYPHLNTTCEYVATKYIITVVIPLKVVEKCKRSLSTETYQKVEDVLSNQQCFVGRNQASGRNLSVC